MKGNFKIEFLLGFLFIGITTLSGEELSEIKWHYLSERTDDQKENHKSYTSNYCLTTIDEEPEIRYDTIFPDFQNLSSYNFYREDSFLLDIVDEYELAYITWRYYKIKYGRRGKIKGHVRKLYTIFAIDRESEKAHKLEVIVKYEKRRRGVNLKEAKRNRSNFTIRVKNKSSLNYQTLLNKFLIAEELKFHQLDRNQLHNKSGPVNENGLARRYDWTHTRNTEVFLKSKDTIGKISSYAPKRLYNLFPKMYPDRKTFMLIYQLFKE